MKKLNGKFALVTGASRGVGRGIALGLGEAGATVYITGRSSDDSLQAEALSGNLQDTARQIEALGGTAICILCDHRNDAETKAVFEQIAQQAGRLDILVNAAWAGYEQVFSPDDFTWANKFWEQPITTWDAMFQVGLRSSFVASQYAARMMLKANSGLIVNVSYWAAQRYMGNVPYGVNKAAMDRLTKDCALELQEHQIAVVSLYPGLVRTERVLRGAEFFDMSNSESEQFSGRAVAALATDPGLMQRSGTVQVSAQLAEEFGFVDIDGYSPKPLTKESAI
ncbi:SDR family NAD(P)-dependent oxidoreductase [Undibacterium parvum]|uniref:SDR family NAD(P)-dependent oxidoreductase n=2 Tax=Undibacterium TaxID=401469 RepID=A0A6M4A3A3_9BURK|nr:SDR family NAD(P)-dependent oxidoreductase [Undibacterium parvum]AZP11286.1 SDR family NAD(P)-dependent oxidoreductase [Undibacterium parvum]QJQ05786.1 SDR family NAD(P)-dependent oxidoreductase [Undibacterium piscinae]